MPGVWNNGPLVTASATGLTALDAVSAYSIGMWVARSSPTGYCTIFQQYGGTEGRDGVRLYFGQSATTLQWCAGTASVEGAVSFPVPPNLWMSPSRWWHLAVVHDFTNKRVRFYQDGRCVLEAGNSRVPTTGGTRTTKIGRDSWGLSVKLFDMQVFPNVMLNAAEVRAMMDPRIAIAGIKARWFRNWSPVVGGTLYDESGNGNNLTLNTLYANAMYLCEEPPWREAIGVR